MQCSKLRLFDHLIGAREHRRRNFEAERFGRLEVDHQLEFGRLFDRQIGRVGTFCGKLLAYRSRSSSIRPSWYSVLCRGQSFITASNSRRASSRSSFAAR
jgi:hypothetical protein